MALFCECTVKCASNLLATGDIRRDASFRQLELLPVLMDSLAVYLFPIGLFAGGQHAFIETGHRRVSGDFLALRHTCRKIPIASLTARYSNESTFASVRPKPAELDN
jgi:hypothetical protein